MNENMCSLSSTLFVTQCPPSSSKSRNLIAFNGWLIYYFVSCHFDIVIKFPTPSPPKKVKGERICSVVLQRFQFFVEEKVWWRLTFQFVSVKMLRDDRKKRSRYSLCTYPFNDEYTPYPQTSLSATPPSPKRLFTIDSIDGVNHWVDMSTHNFICLEMTDTCRGVTY